MKLAVHVRKEFALAFRDPWGIALSVLAPLLIVGTFSLLDVQTTRFPGDFRETSPIALILCLSVWLSTLTLSASALYRERVGGTLERLSVTPFSPGMMISAKALLFGFLGVVQSAVVWLSAKWFLPDQVSQSDGVSGWIGLATLALATAALGLALSAILTSPTQLANVTTFLTLTVVSLSGFFKPLDDLGTTGEAARYIPFTIGYRAVRDVVVGTPLDGFELGLLLLEAILTLVVAWTLLEWMHARRVHA